MNRVRLILGGALATAFVAGSGLIVYYDRPVMHPAGASVNAAVVSVPPAPIRPVARERGEDDEEDEDEGRGSAPAVPALAAPAAPTTASGTPPTAAVSGTYTMADVRGHASAGSCWSAIDGGVYDLTDWINRHPGGANVILGLCGIDGSAAYHGQHGTQSRPAYYLALLKIGTLR